MQTVGDLDLEQLWDLSDELEKHCESKWHTTDLKNHSEEGPLWYVEVTPCACDFSPILLRCDRWTNSCKAVQNHYGFIICPECGVRWNLKVVERAK